MPKSGKQKHIYTKCKEPEMKSYREIADILGTNYVTVGNTLNRAFYKIAEEVLLTVGEEAASRDRVIALARNEEFQQAVADVMREKK